MNGNCTLVMYSTREIKIKLAHQGERHVLHYLHHASSGNHLNNFQKSEIFSVIYMLIISKLKSVFLWVI